MMSLETWKLHFQKLCNGWYDKGHTKPCNQERCLFLRRKTFNCIVGLNDIQQKLNNLNSKHFGPKTSVGGCNAAVLLIAKPLLKRDTGNGILNT